MGLQSSLFAAGDPTNVLLDQVTKHIDRLKTAGLLTENHEVIAAGAIWCATRVGSPSYPAYSFPAGMKELREWLEQLPTAAAADDPFEELARHLDRLSGQAS